jgi:hypothetical protein
LNFFWYFTSQLCFSDEEKVWILDIYHEFLVDFRTNKDNALGVGELIDSLKVEVSNYWNIIRSPNAKLRVVALQVIKECYHQGMVHYLQAAELFLVCLADDVSEIDDFSGKRM